MANLSTLYKELSNNHEITVYETMELYGEKGRFRVMQFSNEAVQGAMDLSDPKRIVLEYPRAIIHLMEYNNPSFEDVFIIGQGIGTIAGYCSAKKCKVAELDNQVVELSKRYFGYNQENIIVGDGRLSLANEPPSTYDYIILDAFTSKGTPRHLLSQEFFRLAKEKLDPKGYVIMNVMGRGQNDKLINAIHSTLSAEFAYTQSFLLPSERATDLHNVIIIGGSKPIGYQARSMAGFTVFQPGQGHIILDAPASDPAVGDFPSWR